MTTEDRLKVLDTLLEGTYSVRANMNDTFAFACSDYEDIEADDVITMLPVIARYGRDALTAYAALKRGAEPIKCRCNHRIPRYFAAKDEIQDIRKREPDFMSD